MPDCELNKIFNRQVQTLATTLMPESIRGYRSLIKGFLKYLHRNYPELEKIDQLQRNPHILGWLRSLAEHKPPLKNMTRRIALYCMRHLFEIMAENGYPIRQSLILPQDIPPRDLHLPKALSPEIDSLLDQELRKTDDLLCNLLLLLRSTGMRVGECLNLKRGSLLPLGEKYRALHVPLGKLHNERLVPMDEQACKIFNRILSLTAHALSDPDDPKGPLFLRRKGTAVKYDWVRTGLEKVANRAGCAPIRPHQLRHTYATAMLRAGISLPALKEILGHRDIKMTMLYVQVTQSDLQRAYHLARHKMAAVHTLPQLPTRYDLQTGNGLIGELDRALKEIDHRLEMYRRQLDNNQLKNRIRSLSRRLVKIRKELAVFKEV